MVLLIAVALLSFLAGMFVMEVLHVAQLLDEVMSEGSGNGREVRHGSLHDADP